MATEDKAQGEGYPLLPQSSNNNDNKQTQVVNVEEDTEEEEEEDTSEDKKLFADGKRRGTSLILNDSILLILHVIQMFCVLQSMAIRWTWPEKWLIATKYVFFVNLDVWEYTKLATNGTYKSIQGYYTPSNTVSINYWYILFAWGVFVVVTCVSFLIIYRVMKYRRRPTVMVHIAQLQRIYIIIWQVVSLPLGVTLARLFHCNANNQVDIDNNMQCFSGIHFAYLGPALAVIIGLYIFLPIWMIVCTRKEIVSMNTDRHEGYLQLKETEFVQGLDVLYTVGNFHIFSSFKKYGAYTRSTLFFITLGILIFYGGLFQYFFAQATVITAIIFLELVAFIVIRPFRVSCFNTMLILSYLCLVGDALLGSMIANYTSVGNPNVWLSPNYLIKLLIGIQVVWVFFCGVFILYLVIRHAGCCHRCYPYPLWPTMTSDGLNKLNIDTRKYVRAILKGRTLVG